MRLMFIYVAAFALFADAASQAINFPTYPDSSESSICDGVATCERPKRCREVLRRFGREVPCGREGVCCVSVRSRFEGTDSPGVPSSPNHQPLSPVKAHTSSQSFVECGVGQAHQIEPSSNSHHTTRQRSGTQQGEFPWMAAVLFRHFGVDSIFCNAFMIDRRHALSAANCFVYYKKPKLYSLRIGNIYYAEGQKFNVSKIKLHEGYRRGEVYDDIAIVTLDKDVDFPGFSPICLPDGEQGKDFDDIKYTVASWGATVPGGIMSTVLLHLHDIPLVPKEVCNEVISEELKGFPDRLFKGITNDIRCTEYSDEENSTCHGDSGCPLMRKNETRWTAEGLLSFEFERYERLPIGYTRISSYLDWIRQNTQPEVELD